MNKDSRMTFTLKIGLEDGDDLLRFDGSIGIEQLAKLCREDWKKGGGCPLGNVLSCPFLYDGYVERHKGERPISCRDVTANDWIELYSIVKEDSKKGR